MDQIFALSISLSLIQLEKKKKYKTKLALRREGKKKILMTCLINGLFIVCIFSTCAHTVDMLQLLVC